MHQTPVQASHIIDCSANPHDLRPAVGGILERIAQVRAHLRADQALVVVLGENHGKPSNVLLAAALLGRLKDQDLPHAFGKEAPHTAPARQLHRLSEFQYSSDEIQSFLRTDQNGSIALRTLLAQMSWEDSPVSYHSLYNYCLRHDINSRFNDAAIISTNLGDILDKGDPATAQLIDKLAPSVIGEISCKNPLGMKIRNQAMVENSKAHIQDSGAAVYVQSCGLSHVFGNMRMGDDFEDSLVGRYKQNGIAVLPVFIDNGYGRIHNIPEEAQEALANGIVIRGLSTREFSVRSQGEAAFIERVADESRMDLSPFRAYAIEENDPEKKRMPTPERLALREDLLSELEDWRNDAGM